MMRLPSTADATKIEALAKMPRQEEKWKKKTRRSAELKTSLHVEDGDELRWKKARRSAKPKTSLHVEDGDELAALTMELIAEMEAIEGNCENMNGLIDDGDELSPLNMELTTDQMEAVEHCENSNGLIEDGDELSRLSMELTAEMEEHCKNLNGPIEDGDDGIAVFAKDTVSRYFPIKPPSKVVSCASVPVAFPRDFPIKPPSKVDAGKLRALAKLPSKEERWKKKLRRKPKTTLHAVLMSAQRPTF